MKKLLVLSGKGGTGKTSIASSLIKMGRLRTFADCDVDAPNLGLLMDLPLPEKTNYYGLDKAVIDENLCDSCDLCRQACRFSAIAVDKDKYSIDPYKCEGCSLCREVCPLDAISMVDNIAGELELYRKDFLFSSASLKMGEGNSGLLVSQVKEQLREGQGELAIIDGSPGIGCPVIASINDVDWVLIVTEPSLSGLSDLERLVATCENFQVPVLVVINKYDVNLDITKKIEDYCRKEAIEIVGKLAFDQAVVTGLNQGKALFEINGEMGQAMEDIYKRTMEKIK